MAKSSIEKAIEKQRKVIEKETKKKIQADKRLADKQQREINRIAREEASRMQASAIVESQPVIGGLKIIDSTAEELVEILASSHQEGSFIIKKVEVSLPDYLEVNLILEFEKLKQYGLISNYMFWISDMWEVSIYPRLLSYKVDKENALKKEEANKYNNNFYGDANNVMIQQGTNNSTQIQVVNKEFNYEAVNNIVEQIRKYDNILDDEFREAAEDIRKAIDELALLLKEEENPSKINAVLQTIKDIAMGTAGGLITSGIIQMVQGVM